RPGVLIDARPDHAYFARHIPGAENLPVGSSLAVYKALFARHSRETTTFIVYCQSAQCGWADTVATGLKLCGAIDVYVYRGGFADYSMWSRADHVAR